MKYEQTLSDLYVIDATFYTPLPHLLALFGPKKHIFTNHRSTFKVDARRSSTSDGQQVILLQSKQP